jgi:hypothetical protein
MVAGTGNWVAVSSLYTGAGFVAIPGGNVALFASHDFLASLEVSLGVSDPRKEA